MVESFETENNCKAVESLLLSEEVYRVVGCAFKVHNTLGSGFLESVYQDALEVEFERAGVEFVHKPALKIFYDGVELKSTFQPDVVCFGSVILELKAVNCLSKLHEIQLINYLKGTGYKVGVLLNFGSFSKLEWRRLVYTNDKYLRGL